MNKPDEQLLICCQDKHIAVLRCPKCKHLFGCCRNCRTIFCSLTDTSLQNVVALEAGINCSECGFLFSPSVSWDQYLAERRDLIKFNLEYLLTEKLEFRVEPRIEKNDDEAKKIVHAHTWKVFEGKANKIIFKEWLANNYLYFVIIMALMAVLKILSLLFNKSNSNIF
jgi:hypothetical protein